MQSISRTRSPSEQCSPATVCPHFILDQNFPWYVVSFPWPSNIGITRLPDHAPDLVQSVEDWEVFLELSKRGGADGFITNDRIGEAPRGRSCSRTLRSDSSRMGCETTAFK